MLAMEEVVLPAGNGAVEAGAGRATALEEDEVSLSPRPCMIKSPRPFVEVAEPVAVGLTSTVTKLSMVEVLVDSVSSKWSDEPSYGRQLRITKHTVLSGQDPASTQERRYGVSQQHGRTLIRKADE